MYAYLFLSNICSTVVVVFHLFLFLVTKIKKDKNKDKKNYIVISNIVINIKKESGGNNAMLIGDFALETSENIFLRN